MWLQGMLSLYNYCLSINPDTSENRIVKSGWEATRALTMRSPTRAAAFPQSLLPPTSPAIFPWTTLVRDTNPQKQIRVFVWAP
jgi:hypothetical protein